MKEFIYDPFDDAYEIDFSDEVYEAIDNARLVTTTESGQHPQEAMDELARLKSLAAQSGGALVEGNDTSMRPDAEVYAEDAHSFPILCRQVFAIVFPEASIERVNSAARAIVEHEMAHATAAMMIGKEPKYGVRIMKTPEPNGGWSFGIMGFIAFSPDQNMTKADWAFIAAATDDPAERDLGVVEALGYSSPEEAIESHPYFRQG